MPFGRTGKLNNRSQHALVESGPASTSPSGGPSNSASPSDSFVEFRAANQPPPPPHVFAQGPSGFTNNTNHQQSQQLHPLNTSNPQVSDHRVRKAAQDFADAVSRSQSQRHHQVTTPVQPSLPYGASSFEDLSTTLPDIPQGQPISHHHQQQQGAPVETKRSSTRRLIKNLITGTPNHSRAGAEHHHSNSQSQNSYDNTTGLARRPSKRVSNPLALRTGPSQVSLEQQPLDWQSQGPHTQPSPLQGVREVTDLYRIDQSNRDIHMQNPHETQQPTLRRVPTNQDTSPSYSDSGSYKQGQIHPQTQPSPEHSQQQYGQVAFDPATQQYQLVTHSPQGQYQGEGNQYLGTSSLRDPERISQLSHDSPTTDIDQPSVNFQSTSTSPAVNYSHQVQEFAPRTSSLATQQPPQQSNMAPPPGGPPPTRRSQETEKNLRSQVEPPPGPPPTYRHSQQPSSGLNTMTPSQSGPVSANPSFRQSTIQDRQFDGGGDQGRNSPQPSEDPEKAFKDLLTKYKNVKRLYFDGKTQIEQLNGQVEQLQNAVANQRMSQSRTALDDSEYTARLNRLNGAINNLSFNIRKDWVSVPSWLGKYISADALKTGKQEMTAIGRAVITRWIVDEVFGSSFHPGLEPSLSKQLKEIEQNIRRFSYTLTSQEEHDALTSKVVSWRMATLEGLQRELNSPECEDHRQDFIRKATSNLTACLFQHLADPPPAGVDGSAGMIVELAVGIASNLPLESRDVAIVYPLPEDNIQANLMEVEKTALPALETRPGDGEGESDESGGKDDKGGNKERTKSRAGMSTSSTISNIFGSSAPSSLVPGSGGSRKGSVASISLSQQSRKPSVAPSVADSTISTALPPKDSSKIRFAGFVAVEVRGRQVLIKAPVWPLA